MAQIRYTIKDTESATLAAFRDGVPDICKRDYFSREEAQAAIDTQQDPGRFAIRWAEVSTRRTKTLAGWAVSGARHGLKPVRVTIRTAADYGLAAVFVNTQGSRAGEYVLLAKGDSRDSVRSRARTAARKSWLNPDQIEIITLREELHPEVEKYFERWHPEVSYPYIVQGFKNGWTTEIPRMPATRHHLETMRQMGYTAVGVGRAAGQMEVLADFDLDWLRKNSKRAA